MNDQQLIQMLRAIDRPVAPERDFAETLHAVLERRTRPRRRPSWTILLAAALLAAAAVGTAIVVGSQILRQQPIVIAPSPAPTTGQYTVSIPFGVTPESTPEEVAAKSVLLGRVTAMTLIVEGTQYPVDGGLSAPLDFDAWEVIVVRPGGETVAYLLEDDGLAFFLPEPAPSDYPEPTLVVVPSWDPSVPLELVSDRGRTIRPAVVSLPRVEASQRIGPLTLVGEIAWAMVTDASSGDMVSLVRLDTRSGTASLVAPPPNLMGLALHPGLGRLWLQSFVASEIYALDADSGELLGAVPTPVFSGGLIGQDADGLWFRISEPMSPTSRFGAALVDPETGAVLRTIYTPDREGAYGGFHDLPSFGSLWDTSEAGSVYRVDAVSGEVAAIDLTAVTAAEATCGTARPAIAQVDGYDELMVVRCQDGDVAIDPATNRIAFVAPVDDDLLPLERGADVGGQRWLPRIQEAAAGAWVGTLVRFDRDGRPIETLSFNRPRVTAEELIVIADAVWMVAAERARADDPFVQNQVLLRIPVAELTG